MITNAVQEAFRNYFKDQFTREPDLISAQFDLCLTNFRRIETTEAAWCEGFITVSDIWEALKLVDRDDTPSFNGLLYELCMRQLPVFVPLLEGIFNN